MMLQLKKIEDLILAEVNVKEMQYLPADNDFIKKRVKPNFVILGKKLGGKMKAAASLITAMEQSAIRKLEQEGKCEIVLEGETIEILRDEVEIQSEDVAGWMVASRNAFTVALDVSLTPELENEGNARELVNRIQKIRKDQDLELTDRINVEIQSDPELDGAFTEFNAYICAEILANNLEFASTLTTKERVEINEKEIYISIEKAS